MGQYAGECYVCTQIIAQAIQNAKSADPTAIRDAIAGHTFATSAASLYPPGQVHFGPTGLNTDGTSVIAQVCQGKLDVVGPRRWPPVRRSRPRRAAGSSPVLIPRRRASPFPPAGEPPRDGGDKGDISTDGSASNRRHGTHRAGLDIGSPMPVNSNGGLLSEAHLLGLGHLVEMTRQLRGTAGPRQIPGAAALQWATPIGDSLIFTRS